jgi:tRNA G18 (ribose-2'-O)-methylase SpoU
VAESVDESDEQRLAAAMGRWFNLAVVSVRSIPTLDLPELAPYRTMRQQGEHYRERIFVAEGEKVVRRLLESDLTVLSALMPADHLVNLLALLERRPEVVNVFVAEKSVLEQLTGFSMYQGLLACARFPPPVELDVALDFASRPRFLVAADAICNAENLGGLIRTATAFGVDAILLGETCAHPYLRRAVRASMGTVFDMPLIEPVSLRVAMGELQRRGVHCFAADPGEGHRPLCSASLQEDCCIVLGSEGDGLSPEVRDACDECVTIPMQRDVDSLNVAAAAAVCLYEVWRQRHVAGVNRQ